MLLKRTLFLLFIVLLQFLSMAQIPKDVPHPSNNTPLDFSNPADIIIYIALPLLAGVFVWIWLRRKKKHK